MEDPVAKSPHSHADKVLGAALLSERIRQSLRRVALKGPPETAAILCYEIVCLEALRELLDETHKGLVHDVRLRRPKPDEPA